MPPFIKQYKLIWPKAALFSAYCQCGFLLHELCLHGICCYNVSVTSQCSKTGKCSIMIAHGLQFSNTQSVEIWMGSPKNSGAKCRWVGESQQLLTNNALYLNKKLSYRRGTSRCVLSVVILPITMQQCRNYLYDKSWPNRWHEVGGLRWANV